MRRMKPHDFQRRAVRRIVRELRNRDRAKVIMPCGTGKTLVGMLARKRLKPRRTLIVAPSLALVKQLLDSYAAEGELSRVLVVCSDDSTAKEARDKYDIPSVTTDPQAVAKALRKRGELTVFSTYQSSPKIAEAYEIGWVPRFDLGSFDEAHRMVGDNSFGTALDDAAIPIVKRLFLTATPRVATRSARQQADAAGITFASMDDESQFGREAFSMSFNEAIEGEHLTDYQVIVFAVKESDIHSLVDEDEDARELAKRVALVRAMGEHDLRKVLAYHRTVRQMNWFAQTGLQRTFEASKAADVVDGTLWSGALSGVDSAGVRRDTLQEFAALNGDHRAVLNNCQVLQEGVDCPAVDAVCLVDPRTQPVDIVQIIGRAIRNSPDKKISTIILPVFIPAEVEDDVEQFVASSAFAPVLDVIAALRSHDDRVQGWVNSPTRYAKSAGSDGVKIKFNFDVPAALQGRLFGAIASRVVRRFRELLPLTEELVWGWMQEYHADHGRWPTLETEELCPDGTRWSALNASMVVGTRGFAGGDSIARFRARMSGADAIWLTESLVWEWMQAFRSKHGRWPTGMCKELCPNGSSWLAINDALRRGCRGLSGGSSLFRLRVKMTGQTKSILTEDQIWRWMHAHRDKSNRWPSACAKGLSPEGSTWASLNEGLIHGRRGLPGGSSLAKLRAKMLAIRGCRVTDSMAVGGPIDSSGDL